MQGEEGSDERRCVIPSAQTKNLDGKCTSITNSGLQNQYYFMELFGIIKKTVNFAPRLNNGAVVQLVRITACHAVGRGFESRPHRKRKQKAT